MVLHGIHFRDTPLISQVSRSGTGRKREVKGLSCGDVRGKRGEVWCEPALWPEILGRKTSLSL